MKVIVMAEVPMKRPREELVARVESLVRMALKVASNDIEGDELKVDFDFLDPNERPAPVSVGKTVRLQRDGRARSEGSRPGNRHGVRILLDEDYED